MPHPGRSNWPHGYATQPPGRTSASDPDCAVTLLERSGTAVLGGWSGHGYLHFAGKCRLGCRVGRSTAVDGRAEFYADLLADTAETLGEPYSRHLGGKVRELRFHLLERQQVRITYWLGPGRRVILLTMVYRTQRSEVAELDRALAVQKECQAEHGDAVDVYDRRNSDE